jgi:hypothetical protein
MIETISSLVWSGLERWSQRAFEGPKRNRPERTPSRSQSIVKAIREGFASDGQVAEAVDFGLAFKSEGGVAELTPLGELVLSRYPTESAGDRHAPKAAAA